MRRRPPYLRFPVALALLVVTLPGTIPDAAAQPADELGRARQLLEAQRAEEALAVVEGILKRRPDHAEALLVRSTVRFMEGDLEAGRRDLERCLALDPSLREGWLNLAGLAVAEERYEEALEAFRQAEELDPAAPENHLNIGTALLLQGELTPASERFDRYLKGHGDTAEGYFLVAKNYALAGYAALAVEHLRRAVELDERARVQAKADPAFTSLADNPRLSQLLATDTWVPPPGAREAARDFPVAYAGGQGPLLRAVLDALQLGSRRFDPRVEVTPEWSLVWGEARIKVSETPDGGGRVELTAPAEAFTAAAWRTFSDDLFRDIAARLAVSAPRTP